MRSKIGFVAADIVAAATIVIVGVVDHLSNIDRRFGPLRPARLEVLLLDALVIPSEDDLHADDGDEAHYGDGDEVVHPARHGNKKNSWSEDALCLFLLIKLITP